MRPLVYISGPITIGDQFANVQRGIHAFNECMDAGIAAICPHLTAFCHMTRTRSHDDWLKLDLEAVLPRCSAVYRLPGVSVGADKECMHAASLGLPVFDYFGDLIRWHQARTQGDSKALVTEGSV